MIKTLICKGDKVRIIRGEGKNAIDEATKQTLVMRVMKVDRQTGHAVLEVPAVKAKDGRHTPRRGMEQWKTSRYNQKTGDAGGLKVIKRPIHVSNLELVEKGPPREFGNK